MKILDHISRARDLHVEGYAIFLFLLSLRFLWMIPCLILYVYLLRKKINWTLCWISCSILWLQHLWITVDHTYDSIKDQVYVNEVIRTDSYDIVIIRYQMMKYRFYASSNLYDPGDLIFIDGEVNKFRGQSIFHGFNAKNYFLSQGIMGEVDLHHIELVEKGFNFNVLKDTLSQHIDSLVSKDYIKAFIFGEKSIPIEEQKTYQSLGIIFLFSISGLHLYALTFIIKKIMFYFNLNQRTQKSLILSVYFIFLYLYSFSTTILRISLLYIFHWINDRYYLKLTHLDLIQCIFFILILFNPYLIYDQGLLIVYLILNLLVLLKPILHGKNYMVRQLKVSGLIQIVLLPFKTMNYLVLLVLMPLIVFFLSGPAFLLAVMSLFFKPIDALFFNLMTIFFKFISNLSAYGIQFFLPAIPHFLMIVYFLIILYIFYTSHSKQKIIGILVIFLLFFVQILKPYDFKTKIMMLDVGQGDTFYFESRDCKMMIDSYQGSLNFLQNRGIYHLNYLFLTHSDTDHIKEAVEITSHIKVDHIGVSYYETYPGLYGSLMPLHHRNKMTCGEFEIDVLGPIKRYENNNDNSLVLKIQVYEKTMLFTGDIENDAENDLIETYGTELKSDLLKVSHHGSITSTSDNFLELVNPTMAWISAGYENRFGFPHQEVMERLKEKSIEIYRTDQEGTILLIYDEKKRKWTVHLPFKDEF